MGVNVKITDHSPQVQRELEKAIERALEKMGLVAEHIAKANLERSPRRVDTGALRNSITHGSGYVDGELKEFIGTNLEYGKYVEYGTGIYVEDRSGRKTPWFVVGTQGKWDGVGFWTRGMKPNHFLKDAASKHKDKYQEILKEEIDAVLK